MANNRMFLVHRPSGMAVFLAKRMGYGWYSVPETIQDRLHTLFKMVEDHGCTSAVNQDDFCLAMENCGIPGALVSSDWKVCHHLLKDTQTLDVPRESAVAKALIDLCDGSTMEDIRDLTGLPVERCKEIFTLSRDLTNERNRRDD